MKKKSQIRNFNLLPFFSAAAFLSTSTSSPAQQAENIRDDRASVTTLSYLSNTTFQTGYRYSGVLVAGVSGIDFDPRTGAFTTVRDNSFGGAWPGNSDLPNVYTLVPTAVSTREGFKLTFDSVTSLSTPGNAGEPWMDTLESVRHDPNGDGVWFASEGGGSVFHWHQDGTRQEFKLPAIVTRNSGNAGLEGLTFTPSGDLWVGREGTMDGDPNGISRLTQIDRTGRVIRQLAYQRDNIGGNGLSEILALSDTTMLVMERAWDGTNATASPNGVSHNSIRIYRIDLNSATDVSNLGTIPGDGSIETASKTLVFNSSSISAALNTYETKIDNVEGMTFGPTLPNGHASLVMVSDNNNSRSQGKTQFIVFRVDSPIPEIQYWDGADMADGKVGGSGIWKDDGTLENWARDGGWINDAWAGKTAVFAGSAGTVTIDAHGRPVTAAKLSFLTSGYRLEGGPLTLSSPNTEISVDDPTTPGTTHNIATIAAPLTGAGGLHKTGMGTLILAGDNDYRGSTTVSAGTLRVNGSLQGQVIVQDGGALGGNGIFGSVVVQSGGTLAPANSIGTLTTSGDVQLANGSFFDVEVDRHGRSDRVNAGGKFIIGQNVQLRVGPEDRLEDGSTYQMTTRYPIVTAGQGVSGQFAGIDNAFSFLAPTLSYDAGVVTLILNRVDENGNLIHFADFVSTANQKATANAVEALGSGNPLFDAVLYLPDGAPEAAFDSLSGPIHSAVVSALFGDAHRAALVLRQPLDRMLGASSAGAKAAGVQFATAADSSLSTWISGQGFRDEVSGDRNYPGTTVTGGGIFLGGDVPISENTRLGMLLGYSNKIASAGGQHSDASVDGFDLGIYGGVSEGPARLSFGAIYGWDDISTRRSVAFPRFAEQLSAKYEASTLQSFATASWRFDLDPLGVEPFLRLGYTHLDIEAFNERGGIAGLSSHNQTEDQMDSTLGINLDRNFRLEGAEGIVSASIGWRHAFSAHDVSRQVAFAGGDEFRVAVASAPRDSALVGIGLDMSITKSAALSLRYDGEIGDGFRNHAVNVSFGVKF